MTLAEFNTALKTLGMPVAYGEFKKPTSPPFITYQSADNDDLIADNHNYVDIPGYAIELYTIKKDTAKEKLVQDKLKELRLPYSKTPAVWIETEKMWQVVYTIQLIGG